MQLTAEQFAAATGCPRGSVLTWAKPIADACALYDITTPARLCAFLAQVSHESQGFTRTVENLNYSADRLLEVFPSHFTPEQARECQHKAAAIGNRAYGGRLGNIHPNDGSVFRGRGLIMVTGRTNYEAVTELLHERLSSVPDLGVMPGILAEPKWAAYSAAAFWVDHGLNELADIGAFDKITKRVNGGMTGSAERRALYAKCKQVFA